jgi:hypothetical protein
MHYMRLILVFVTAGLYSAAALPSEEVEKLQDKYKGHMKVWAVTEDDYETGSGKEFFVLKFQSRQDIRDNDLKYEMHVTVQLTDKKTGITGYAEAFESPGPITDIDRYINYTMWEFRIPFGDMKKPKMTACVIEFGFVHQGQFIPISVECDKADSSEQIIAAGGTELDIKCRTAAHQYRNER